MKASVIIPTKNGGPLFEQVLLAVLGQDAPWSFEVLIIDSGSRDGTLACCERHRAGHPNLRVHCIAPAEFGHGRTRNLAISMTQGDFLALLTQDALPANRHWLRELVAAVEQAPDIAGAFGRHRAYPNASPFTARDLDAHFNGFLAWPPVVRLGDNPDRYRADPGYRQVLHFFSNCNACLRRALWEIIPFPDVDFAEDQIWARTIIEAGHGKAYADRALVYHSHDFGFWEQGRRSFDESVALKRLFGYRLCPSLSHLLGQTARTTLADWHHAYRQRFGPRQWHWLLRSPPRNLFRQLGHYLGARAERLPAAFVERYSRDTALRAKT